MITRRLVFQLGGYDPMSPEAAYRRFSRELRRFETTWGVTAHSTELEVTQNEARWRVVTAGPNWGVDTEYRLIRWDDVITNERKRSNWQRIPLGLHAFADFIWNGAFLGYLRTNWRYAGFFLYPYVLLSTLVMISFLSGIVAAKLSGYGLIGGGVAFALFVGLLQWPGRRLFLQPLLDDWIFALRYIRREHPVLGPRFDRVAASLCEAARAGEADELLIIGHSLGAVLAVDLLDRAVRLDARLGQAGASIAFVSVASSIPKIGLHRAAARFRAAVERIANTREIFWGEYQTVTDVMNFYKVDPVSEMGLTGRSPLIRQVRVKAMLDPVAYRRIRRNLFRVHCQFVSGNDRRAPYDYFMLLCGPLSAENQARSRDGAASLLGPSEVPAKPFFTEATRREFARIKSTVKTSRPLTSRLSRSRRT